MRWKRKERPESSSPCGQSSRPLEAPSHAFARCRHAIYAALARSPAAEDVHSVAVGVSHGRQSSRPRFAYRASEGASSGARCGAQSGFYVDVRPCGGPQGGAPDWCEIIRKNKCMFKAPFFSCMCTHVAIDPRAPGGHAGFARFRRTNGTVLFLAWTGPRPANGLPTVGLI